MKKRKFTYLIVMITFILSICTGLYGEEVDEEKLPADDKPDKVTWLDNIPDSFGSIELLWELNRHGDESLFDRRYFDRYKSTDLRFENVDMFHLMPQNAMFDAYLSTNWHTKSITEMSLSDPLKWRIDFDSKDSRFFEIPSLFEARRKDSKVELSIGGYNTNTLELTGNVINRSDNSLSGTSFDSQWKTRDFGLKYNFDIPDYDVRIGYSKRSMKGERSRIHDITHSTWTLNAGAERGANAYLSGNASYTSSNVQYYDSMTSFTLGGAGRFINPLGIDNMIVSAGVNYVDRNDNVRMLHPSGDSLGMYLRARYRASKDVRLHGALDLNRNDTYIPDRTAIDEIKATRGLIPLQAGKLESATIRTNRTRFGTNVRLTDNTSVLADWRFVRRRGLEDTHYGFDNSPLIRDKEFSQEYKLRYKSGRVGNPGFGNWELKYKTHDKSINPRDLTDSSEHLSVNWSGFLSDDFFTYAGVGYRKTSLNVAGTKEHDLKGREYGIGFDWSMSDRTNLYFDYWNYDISGNDDFEQICYIVGINCRTSKDWSLGIEYERVDNSFNHPYISDGRTGFLNLRMKYEW